MFPITVFDLAGMVDNNEDVKRPVAFFVRGDGHLDRDDGYHSGSEGEISDGGIVRRAVFLNSGCIVDAGYKALLVWPGRRWCVGVVLRRMHLQRTKAVG